jgi:ferredoxin-NADP reductase
VGALAAGYMSTGSALWWVGSTYMLIGVAILAFLVVKKTRRFALFFSAVLSSFITVGILSFVNHLSLTDQLSAHLLSWPIIFFASIMITEPLSTPATRKLQVIYSLGVGTLSAIPFSFGPIYNTPQLALLVGNIFAFIVGMKERLTLYLVSKVQIARDTYEFVFKTSSKLHYIPGQYLEYVLPHAKPDSRGIRRYFTIASSPTEAELKLGIRMAPANGSSFKKALMNMNPSQTMIASRLAGDFTMPAESTKKLVFIAGGIGITPFRSMVQYLLDTKTKRDIVIFYANKTPDDIAYSDLWSRAENELGIKVVHVMAEVYVDWRGESGFITADMVKKYVGDHIHATYYISGPTGMVNAYKKLLRSMSVSRSSIVTDYFPGFA